MCCEKEMSEINSSSGERMGMELKGEREHERANVERSQANYTGEEREIDGGEERQQQQRATRVWYE